MLCSRLKREETFVGSEKEEETKRLRERESSFVKMASKRERERQTDRQRK